MSPAKGSPEAAPEGLVNRRACMISQQMIHPRRAQQAFVCCCEAVRGASRCHQISSSFLENYPQLRPRLPLFEERDRTGQQQKSLKYGGQSPVISLCKTSRLFLNSSLLFSSNSCSVTLVVGISFLFCVQNIFLSEFGPMECCI